MQSVMNIKMQVNISLEKIISQKVYSNVVLQDQWLDILNFLINKNMNTTTQDLWMEKRISWQDQHMKLSRRKFNTLKTHMREKKIWENWIIKEELLKFWINLSHFQILLNSTVLLILLEKHMEQTESSMIKSSQNIQHQALVLSELVTYLKKVTINH